MTLRKRAPMCVVLYSSHTHFLTHVPLYQGKPCKHIFDDLPLLAPIQSVAAEDELALYLTSDCDSARTSHILFSGGMKSARPTHSSLVWPSITLVFQVC